MTSKCFTYRLRGHGAVLHVYYLGIKVFYTHRHFYIYIYIYYLDIKLFCTSITWTSNCLTRILLGHRTVTYTNNNVTISLIYKLSTLSRNPFLSTKQRLGYLLISSSTLMTTVGARLLPVLTSSADTWEKKPTRMSEKANNVLSAPAATSCTSLCPDQHG